MIDELGRPYPVRTVRQFTNGMAEYFNAKGWLQHIGLKGEISGLREFGGGHLAFTLKDQQSIIECVAWSDSRRSFPDLGDGVEAIAYGSVRIHSERGGYKLYVEAIEQTGSGNLFLLYERLKERFRLEGLFEQARKREIPELPRRVALVSARDGKGAQDFMKTIRDELPFVEVVSIETRVQGEGAEIDIAAALDVASQSDVDAIVLARGGGTYEDRFPFNLEPVVRAIVRARAPVLTAIGHEPDHHLADDVADRSFGTPSKAAEFIAKGWVAATRHLRVASRDLDRAVRQVALHCAQHLDSGYRALERTTLRVLAVKRATLAEHNALLERESPQRRLAETRARVAGGNGRLDTAAARLMSRKAHSAGESRASLERSIATLQVEMRRRLERAENVLERCDPLAPLARGYAIVTQAGRVLRDAAGLKAGDAIRARLERGMLEARVESVHDDG
jgi:exodeoxyribonuclease VII large subunit